MNVFEKILERLEEPKFYISCLECQYMEKCDELEENITNEKKDLCAETMRAIAKEIVQEVAEEFATDTNVGTNGWIPCSEKLPELRQNVLVTVKYTGFMGMHGYWIKTGHMEAENDWWGDCAGGEVIAWQPLPLPYQPKGE